VIWDRLDGEGTHQVETCMHFDPAVRVAQTSEGLVARHGDAGVVIRVLGPGDVAARLAQGGEGPEEGWIAPSYGHLEPAWVARFTVSATLPATLWQVYRLSPDQARGFQARTRPGRGGEGLVIEEPQASRWVIVSWHPGATVTLGELETDAQVLVATRNASSGEVRVDVLEGSHVKWCGREMWRSADRRPLESFQAHLPGLEPGEAAS
jgi:hypothetical protein